MPHAGLMDERELGPEAGPLLRAKLHIRGGKRRLHQGKIAAGIVTLYDALSAAMEWYINRPGCRETLRIQDGDNLDDERTAYAVLNRSGILDGSFDYDAFDILLERALHEDLEGFDYRRMLKGLESIMTQLGVMPFDEAALPPEDPSTY